MDFTSGGLYFLGEVGRRWTKRLVERNKVRNGIEGHGTWC